MTPTTIAAYLFTAFVVIALVALIVCALIGALHMVQVFRSHRRPWDDQPPASWLTKQRGDQ